MSEIHESVQNISLVSLDEVRLVANRYLKSQKAGYLLLGDRSQIEPQLNERNFTSVEILELEDLRDN